MDKPLIMVVEDDFALLEGIRELLELTDYQVIPAANGMEALELLDRHKPDLIVSDIMMPEMDGYEFHSKVRERVDLLTIPFIFLTARGEKVDIRRGKSMGADDYITKPFDDEDLLVAIQAKLTRWQSLREKQDEEIADLKHKILLTLSHEFRTPLTYIINYAEILNMGDEDLTREDFSDFMQGIRRGAVRLNTLVEDFLALVELQTGEALQAYYYRRTRLDDPVAWLRIQAKLSEPKAKEANLELEVDIPEDLPSFVVDEAYLSDALRRLLDNAIKFSDEKSEKVRFSARAEKDHIVIRIEDEGIGIPEEEVARLFNIFHQIDRAKTEQQGTGSGLAIAKGIFEIHGGTIEAESKLGVGSTFTVSLPINPPDVLE
jgi:two-component system sensor histidine kinase/response regulator